MAYATQEDFEQFRAEINERYEQTRKLLTVQSVAVEQKLQALSNILNKYVSRRPDPTIVREYWIRKVPEIMDLIKSLQMKLARMEALPKETKK